MSGFNDPTSAFNRTVLRVLRHKYPDMTAAEMFESRKQSLATLRKAIRDNGDYAPDDDEELFVMLKKMGVLP